MPKMKYLASLSEEIEKFTFETETQAQAMIDNDLTGLRTQRDMVIENAKKALAERKATLVELQVELDKAAGAGDNSTKPPPMSKKIEENILRTVENFEHKKV
jgi:hypothetical protein